MPSPTRRPTPRILALTGFMGSGKSSVGRELAALAGYDFLDLDSVIEAGQQHTIAELFRLQGEPRFRELEGEALRQTLDQADRPLILALGGGAFVQPANAELLRARAVPVVFLETPIEVLLRRCFEEGTADESASRPLAADREAFLRLYQHRLPHYRKADVRVDAAGKSASVIAREIATAFGLGPGNG